MLPAASRAVFHALAQSGTIQRLASRYGMRSPTSFARRFIAGETLEEAIEVARRISASGMLITLDYLGESVRSRAAAEAACREYLELIARVEASGIERNLSLKLTQLGLDIERDLCRRHLTSILEAAGSGFFVRIDMENSPYTDVTLDLFEELWTRGFRNVGVVLQSCLRRSEQDMRRVVALGARIRLVKGAYQEPASVAYQSKQEVDAAFVRMMEALLVEGVYPAIATHDPAIIERTKQFAAGRNIGPERYEFQMLFGVRRDLQRRLSGEGRRVRVYIPFGSQWYPYFMRRLGERPANVGFVVRSLLAERFS